MKKAFTLVELLVVISIIALLLAIMMPAMQKARAQAKSVVCLTMIKQIGLALGTYAASNRDTVPPERWWDYSANHEKFWSDLLVQTNPALSGIVCPLYPWKDRGFADPKIYACAGGYGINNELDGVSEWATVDPTQGGVPRPVVRTSSFKRTAETLFVLDSAADVLAGAATPRWDYMFVDYLTIVPNSNYKKKGNVWAHIGGQIRADHGTKTLQTRKMQPNYVFSGKEEMDQVAKLNVLFLDQHAEKVLFGAVRKEEGVRWVGR